MDKARQALLSDLLYAGARELDLTPTQHARAVEHYEAVGSYLDEGPLMVYSPLIFTQGSIAIGTATKPIGKEEYDIDLMCKLRTGSQNLSPAELKLLVGNRLKEHTTYKNMLTEKNRCWRLSYAGEFHMDIIPSIPDSRLVSSGSLLVPDKQLHCWKETHPEAYTTWFLNRAATSATTHIDMKNGAKAEVEPAPSSPHESQKLPLQVIVQLLKRHRDLMFGDDEDAPISIILTTLAAQAYEGREPLTTALSRTIERMPSFIGETIDGFPLVANPVNPLENFADKWKTHERREQQFKKWITQAQQDFQRLEIATLPTIQDPLQQWVGDRVAKKTLNDYGTAIHLKRDVGLAVSGTTGILGSAASGSTVASPKHTFYGV